MTSNDSHIDSARSHLRVLVETIDREVSHLPNASSEEEEKTQVLRSSWTELVKVLALGPEPLMRPCPSCARLGMRDATVCAYCWTKLVPPAPEASKAT